MRHSRHDPVTVVTGAPGCGNSHALAAIALDAVDRGESVLIATQSVHAADVLGDLMARQPGPAPVMFGDAEKREAIVTELSSGSAAGHGARAARETDRAAEVPGQLVCWWRRFPLPSTCSAGRAEPPTPTRSC